jgi:hypothetical protein
MSHEYVKVFTGSSILTSRLQQLLDDRNIASRIRDDEESGRLAGFGAPRNSSQLYVLESDLQAAQPIVVAFEQEIDS